MGYSYGDIFYPRCDHCGWRGPEVHLYGEKGSGERFCNECARKIGYLW